MLFCGSFAATAGEHVFGGDIGYGVHEICVSEGSLREDSVNLESYYRYMFVDYVGIEAAWLYGTKGFGSFLVNDVWGLGDVEYIEEIKDISYKGPNLKLYLRAPISESFAFYTKVGANRYKLEYKLKKTDNKYDETEIGFEATAGFEVRFSSGVGFDLGYRYIDNSILESKQISFGSSFSF